MVDNIVIAENDNNIKIRPENGQKNITWKNKKKVIRNAFFNSGAWILTVLISLIATPLMMKFMGEESFGVYLVLSGLIGYYGLLDIGVGQGIIKYVSEYNAKSEKELIISVLNTSLMFQIITGFIGTVFIIILLNPILVILKIPPQHLDETKASLFLFALSFFFLMIAGTFSSVLVGLQMFVQRSKIDLFVNLIMNLSFIIVLYFGMGLLALSLVNLASSMLLVLIFGIKTKSRIPFWVIRFQVNYTILRELFSYSSFYFITKLYWMFNNYFVRFLVGFILGPVAVTFYSVPAKMINAAGGILWNGVNVLFPYISELNSLQELEEIQKLSLKSSRVFAIITAILYTGLIILAKPILSLWISPSFAERTWLILVILSISGLIGSITTVPIMILMGLGHTRIIGIFSILSFIVCLIIVPVLTYSFGIIGTAIAMIVGSIPGIGLAIFGMRKVFYNKVWAYFGSTTSMLLLPVLVTIAAVLYIGLLYPQIYNVFMGLMLLTLAVYFYSILLHEGYLENVVSLFQKDEA